jgi:spore coat polysaccharide biosynthesis protein SpsF
VRTKRGGGRHRSELCTLYMCENPGKFFLQRLRTEIPKLQRPDIRLTVDYPEDLVLCRAVYREFKHFTPRIPLQSIIDFLDANPQLKSLVDPYIAEGLKTMYL